MPIDSKLLEKIRISLYDVESSIEAVKLDFKKQSIDVDNFLEVIEFYIENFNKLKNFEQDESLVTLLSNKLDFILKNYPHLSIYLANIKANINFIIKHKNSFFSENLKELKKEVKKEDTTFIENINTVYLDAIKIKNYFSIKDIELINLKDKKEIYFVGANGDGKTILLQAILLALKKEYSGQIIEYIRNIEDGMELSIKDEVSETYNKYKNIKNVFAYGINRNKTREKFDIYGYSGLFDTSDFKETTFLKNPLDILKNDNELVKKLNEYILVHSLKIENTEGKVLFKEDKNIIEFERLSEGFRSTIIWICDLVSRLRENQKDIDTKVKNIEDFKAIVLIDEVDLYLHPKWKYDFIYNLREMLPEVQFIMITHSTATILGASKYAVFYKVYKEDGETKISHPMDNIKNLMANNLSTSPLFDMDTARARNSDKNIDTSDDFIYSKIHKIIAEQVKGKKAIIEDDVVKMIDKELDDFLKENDL